MIKSVTLSHWTTVPAISDLEPRQATPPPSKSPPRAKDGRLLALVTEHHAGVWRFLRRLGLAPDEADDALQEVILIVARKLAGVRPGTEPAYLYGTAARVAHGHWRRRARRAEVAVEVNEISNAQPPLDSLVEQRQRRALLDELLALMPGDLRTVFVLYEIEGLTMAEIAEVLDIPPGTVASRLRRARADFEQRVARIEARRRAGGQR